jgi:hypothetical protein
MQLEVILALAMVGGTVVLFWTLARYSAAKIARQFALLAEKFDLELTEPPPMLLGFVRPEPSVYGVYRDREISVSVPGTGFKNTRQIESLLKVELRDQRMAAQFHPKGLLTSIQKRLSKVKTRWQSGETSFDEAIVVYSDAGRRLDRLITEERRQWLEQTLRTGRGVIQMGGGALTYAELGLISDETRRQRFESAIAFLCDLAESIEE